MFRLGLSALMIGVASLANFTGFSGTAVAQLSASSETGVFVNRQQMTEGQVSFLVQMVGAPIGPGNYWYDHATGLYGVEGGPSLGQIAPSLSAIMYPVSPDASGGRTGVFINGRALHPSELADLKQMYGAVADGHYFMNAYGQVVPQAPGYFPAPETNATSGRPSSVYGVVDSGQGIYLPELGGRSGGTHLGRASDGCIYVSAGEYSSEVCD